MLFLRLLLSGLISELRAILGIMPLLHRPFWAAYAFLFIVAFVGLLPGTWAVLAQILVLLAFGMAGLFSGALARRVRRSRWVGFPDGPEVAHLLPQLLALLVGAPYLLAMLVLFRTVGTHFPEWLPINSWQDALAMTADNLMRTQAFFDLAECFHWQLGGPVVGVIGMTIVLVSRLLMDLVFVKLAIQFSNAAYFRALGSGRGDDRLSAVKQAIEASEPHAVRYLCGAVGDSLRGAVDTLRRHWETGGDKAQVAWRCLLTMRDYALPYLGSRHRAATGAERERLARLMAQLDKGEEAMHMPSVRHWPLLVLAVGLLGGMIGVFFLPAAAALALTAALALVLSWMLAGSRGWLDRLVRWRALKPSTPDRLARLQLGWSLSLLPLVLVCWALLFRLVALHDPGVFGASDTAVTYPSSLLFVLDNLLHTQIFVGTFEIYGVGIADLKQDGLLGGLLTFLLRLTLNVGMIALLVSFGAVWFNRVFRKFAVSPNAELRLRQQATECGPQAAQQLGYHLREIRAFLVEQIRRQHDNEMLVALAASSFLKTARAERGAVTVELAAARSSLGTALAKQGYPEDAEAEYRQALEIYDQLVREGRVELRHDLARTRMNLSLPLLDQGRPEEAEAEYRQALEIHEQLVREGRAESRYDLAMTRCSLGTVLRVKERLEEALAEYRQALEIHKQLLFEGRVGSRHDLASTRSSLGHVLRDQGRMEEAVAEYRQALDIYRHLVREGHTELRHDLAHMRNNLGNTLRNQGRIEEAVAEYHQALDICKHLVREGSGSRHDLAMTQANLGNGLRIQGRLAEALAEFLQALEVFEQSVRAGQFHLMETVAQCWYSAFFAAADDGTRSLLVRQALAFLEDLHPHFGEFSALAREEVLDFLRVARESAVHAPEAAALALRLGPANSTRLTGEPTLRESSGSTTRSEDKQEDAKQQQRQPHFSYVKCGRCKTILKVADKNVHTTLRCPTCRRKLRIRISDMPLEATGRDGRPRLPQACG